jgi:hypothetical protein
MSLIYLFYFVAVVIIFFVVFQLFFNYYHEKSANKICKYSFPIDISFELVKEGKIKKFLGNCLGGRTEIEIGNNNFDSQVYVSSDIAVMRRVLMNSDLRDMVLDILSDKYIKGIYVKNKQIMLATKLFSKQNQGKYHELEMQYNSLVVKLKDILFSEVQKVRVDQDELSFTKSIQKRVYQLEAFYLSLLTTGLIFVLYFCGLDWDSYFCLDGFSFRQLFYAALVLFIPMVAISLYMIRGSSRRHLLVVGTLSILLPACFFIGGFGLYYLNIALDGSVEVASTETVYKESVKSGKSRYYYLYLNSSNNLEFKNYHRIKISEDKYKKLPTSGEVNFGMKQGYFNVQYIWIKK